MIYRSIRQGSPREMQEIVRQAGFQVVQDLPCLFIQDIVEKLKTCG